MFKRFIKYIAKRYRYWRYRRLLKKLYRKYAKKYDDSYSIIRNASDDFFWFTGEKVSKGWDDHQYFWYL